MRRGIRNELQIRVKDMDLTTCSDMILMIQQCGQTVSYTGTADETDHELMNVTIPKADAVKYKGMPAKFQVALTDADGIPRSHKPIVADIGDFLEVSGYGS